MLDLKILTRANLRVIKTNITAIYLDFIATYKLGQIGPKIKVSLNLYENSHTSQFEDSEYKYNMIRGFLNSNPDLGNCSSSIQTLWDWHENFPSS